MTFANIFSNLIDARNTDINSANLQIEQLEAQIQAIREYITRIEVQKAEVLESQQLVDSALQQLQRAVDTVSTLAPEGLPILREQALAILDGQNQEPQPIAYLEASVEEVPIEETPEAPIEPSDSGVEQIDQDPITPDESVEEVPTKESIKISDKTAIEAIERKMEAPAVESILSELKTKISKLKKAEIIEQLKQMKQSVDETQSVIKLRRQLENHLKSTMMRMAIQINDQSA